MYSLSLALKKPFKVLTFKGLGVNYLSSHIRNTNLLRRPQRQLLQNIVFRSALNTFRWRCDHSKREPQNKHEHAVTI